MCINKLTILNAFVLIFLFISFFQFNITQILHYVWLINASLIFIACKDIRGLPWGLVSAYALLVFSILIHSFFIADYVDIKYAVNQVGFMLSSSSIILLYSYLPDEQKESNFIWFKSAVNILMFIIIGVLVFLGLKEFILAYDYNGLYHRLLGTLYIHKIGLGLIFAWYISFMLAGKKNLAPIILLLLVLVVGFGIRSLMLALVLFLLFHFIQKSFYGRKFIYFMLIVFFIYITFFSVNIGDLAHFDIRGLSLQLALDIARDFPLGIGLGGFDEFVILEPGSFTKSNYLQFISPNTLFYKSEYLLTELPSEILILTVTFGTLITCLYYLMIMRMIFFVYAIRFLLLNHERVILNVFIIYTFMGVTRHPIFTLSWWIVINMFVFIYIKYRNKTKILQ
mgnify:CR=1 FL=1